MDSIQTKIQIYTLELLTMTYDKSSLFYEENPKEYMLTKEFRAIKDILDRLVVMLKKKQIDKEKFKKSFPITMQYNQAFYFEKYIRNNQGFVPGQLFEQTLVKNYIDQLHQKLS